MLFTSFAQTISLNAARSPRHLRCTTQHQSHGLDILFPYMLPVVPAMAMSFMLPDHEHVDIRATTYASPSSVQPEPSLHSQRVQPANTKVTMWFAQDFKQRVAASDSAKQSIALCTVNVDSNLPCMLAMVVWFSLVLDAVTICCSTRLKQKPSPNEKARFM